MKSIFGERVSAKDGIHGLRKTVGYLEIEKYVDEDCSFYFYIIPKSENAVWIAALPLFDMEDLSDEMRYFNYEQMTLLKKYLPKFCSYWQNGQAGRFHNFALYDIDDSDVEGKRLCFVSTIGNLDGNKTFDDMLPKIDKQIDKMLPEITELHTEIQKALGKMKREGAIDFGMKALDLIGNFALGFMGMGGMSSGDVINQNLSNMKLPKVFTDAGFHM